MNYTIKYGDTLSGIALKNGTTVQALMSANSTIKDPNKISAGSALVIPKSGQSTIQNTTAQRTLDTNAQTDYNNIIASKGMNTANSTQTPANTTGTNGTNTQTGSQNGSQNGNQNGGTQNPPANSNPTGLIDSLYLAGSTDPADILSKSNGQLDLDTINKRLATLNADPTFKANADVMSGFQKNLKALDDEKLMLDNQFASLKTSMDAENKSAVDSIQANFALRRDQLKGSYTSLIGMREKQGYQTDAYRYTPNQQNGLVTNDEQNYLTNLAELDAQEKTLLMQASSAKAKGDWEFLAKSVEMYNTVNDKRKSVLGDMLKVSVENNKKITADNKIKAEASNLDTAKQGSIADNIAPSIAEQLKGLDETARNTKLQEIATKYKVGIETLKSSVMKAEESATKTDLTIAQKNKTLNKSTAPKGKAPAKETADQAVGSYINQFKKIIKAKNWKGVNPDDYDAVYNDVITRFGYSAGKKLQDALANEGIIIDN